MPIGFRADRREQVLQAVADANALHVPATVRGVAEATGLTRRAVMEILDVSAACGWVTAKWVEDADGTARRHFALTVQGAIRIAP